MHNQRVENTKRLLTIKRNLNECATELNKLVINWDQKQKNTNPQELQKTLYALKEKIEILKNDTTALDVSEGKPSNDKDAIIKLSIELIDKFKKHYAINKFLSNISLPNKMKKWENIAKEPLINPNEHSIEKSIIEEHDDNKQIKKLKQWGVPKASTIDNREVKMQEAQIQHEELLMEDPDDNQRAQQKKWDISPTNKSSENMSEEEVLAYMQKIIDAIPSRYPPVNKQSENDNTKDTKQDCMQSFYDLKQQLKDYKNNDKQLSNTDNNTLKSSKNNKM